jgi:hypothetical protein
MKGSITVIETLDGFSKGDFIHIMPSPGKPKGRHWVVDAVRLHSMDLRKARWWEVAISYLKRGWTRFTSAIRDLWASA